MKYMLSILFIACSASESKVQTPPLSDPPVETAADPATVPGMNTGAYAFTSRTLQGKPFALAELRGKVVLVVNTASACGYTPQYAGLQALHERFAARGLAIIGFPSNDFGGQEPGSEAEIASFCQKNYGVTFQMMSKVHATGPEIDPIYNWLTSNAQYGGPVKWNFTKFLLSKQGEVIGRFESAVKPDAPELLAAVEAALAQ